MDATPPRTSRTARRHRPFLAAALAAAVATLSSACTGDGGTGPPGTRTDLRLELENVPPLDPAAEGSYEAWVLGSDDVPRSAGRFQPDAAGEARLTSPLAEPEVVMITVEPPGDDDDLPSVQELVGGAVAGGTAELTIDRFLTAGVPLVEEPGTHVLFTPSDNVELGYPSNEDSGIWLFNIGQDSATAEFYLRFSNLSKGWQYEGWLVRDHGTEDACWLSYGKFEPDNRGRLTHRDDTGVGAYSGQIDYEEALPLEITFPGDDWVGNPHGYPLPCGLELPVDLNGDARNGIPSRWTHVVTVEPVAEEEEPAVGREPFFVRPYRNPVGTGFPREPRTIELHPELLPRGTARVVRGGG